MLSQQSFRADLYVKEMLQSVEYHPPILHIDFSRRYKIWSHNTQLPTCVSQAIFSCEQFGADWIYR